MNYEKLKIKDKFVGKILADHNKRFILTDDLDAKSKKYIYNMITKQVFDLENSFSAATDDSTNIEIINVILAPVEPIEEVKDNDNNKEVIEEVNTEIIEAKAFIPQYKKKRGRPRNK